MRKQMRRMGLSYDWSTEVTTCLPDYYRWNQWFFLKMFEKGLAYRKKSKVNWCPQCQTVLANEQVISGVCWRHDDQIVEQRDLTQWFLRITQYADELLDGLDSSRAGRRRFARCRRTGSAAAKARSSSSRSTAARAEDHRLHDTGGHDLWRDVDAAGAGASDREAAWQASMKAGAESRAMVAEQKAAREAGDLGAIEKHGVATGRFAINPFNGERVPIWVANYILADYGTGAIMSVPAHDERDFEFATKYGLPIRRVSRTERR